MTPVDDAIRMWVNDKLVIDEVRSQTKNPGFRADVELGDAPVPIKIEFSEGYGGATVGLKWEPRGRPEEVIPPTSLFHLETEASLTRTEIVPPTRGTTWVRGGCFQDFAENGLLVGLRVATEGDLIRSIQPIFHPDANQAHNGPSKRPAEAQAKPINARGNVEAFAPVKAKFVRLTILATNDDEAPCIDEIGVYSAPSNGNASRNVALAVAGAKAEASGSLSGSDAHRVDHVNDGRYGNENSWISDEPARGWVRIELAEPTMIRLVIWGRDETGTFTDRTPIKYSIEVAETSDQWREVARSDGRLYNGVRVGVGALKTQQSQRESTVLAKTGYAVGALIAQAGEQLDGFQVVFMRMNGSQLETDDRVYSEWLGRHSEQPKIRIGGTGEKAVGVQGRFNDGVIDGVGLLMAPGQSAKRAVGGGYWVMGKPRGKVESQDMTAFGAGKWDKDDQLWWSGAQPGDKLDIVMRVEKDGTYRTSVTLSKAPDYAIVQFYVDDKKTGEQIDLYNNDAIPYGPIELGTYKLDPGDHKLTVEIVGANEKAVKPYYMFGLDQILLKSVK